MCGICGFIGEEKAMEEKQRILEDMLGTIRHRGPDGKGICMDNTAALGFCRLSLVDPEGGAQPMKNESGDITLVFNGEIYNHRELRSELVRAGHRFSSQCDAEVALHGYEEWGSSLPGRLRGMFAFVIWDSGRRELFAARDFFGIKPLYYMQAGKAFVFASEIKGLLRYPGFIPRLNEEALEQYLSFQYSVLEESFFRGIYRLEPGSWLRFAAGSPVLEIRRIFEPSLEPEQEGKQSEKEWTDLLETALRKSVELHEQADTEVGCFLSGGVDSALSARYFHGNRAYTVGFEGNGKKGEGYNEIPQAAATAENCGLKHTKRLIGQEEFWQAAPEVLYYIDEPLGDPSAVALYFLCETASREVKAVLSGEGADELFGGYRIYCEPEALRRWQLLPSGFRRSLAELARRFPERKGRNFLIRGSQSIEERFIGNANVFTCEERRKVLKQPFGAPSPARLLEGDYNRTKRMRDADRMQEIDLRRWLPGDILQKADRMSMAHSLEIRVPYLDKEVFELARRLPGSLKQKGRVTKYILRRVAARSLSAAASERPKLGFPVPLRDWMREDAGYRRVKAVFEGEAARMYFRQEEILRLLEEHRRGRRDYSRKLWCLYAFCIWYEMYFL